MVSPGCWAKIREGINDKTNMKAIAILGSIVLINKKS
jgi:hypothetical protein